MSEYISPLSEDVITKLCGQFEKNYNIKAESYDKYSVKRGLRNPDGTGVMAGLTRICSVDGYYMVDGERVPKEGTLVYRGINLNDIVNGCHKDNRFGYEEIAWILLFGTQPTESQIKEFSSILSDCRNLPDDFIEDMIMKAPSPNIMNKMARSIMALYSYDINPDDTSVENVLRQSIQLIAQLPTIMSYAYQVKRRHYYHKSMYIHQLKPEHCTAETVLNAIRSDRQFTDEEAKLLDTCLMVHAEHGGGNNSTFATRVLTSSGTDTYSAIAAGIGALKGPRHGGANAKVVEMVNYIKENVADINDAGQVADYLTKIINKEAGDGSGLIYGMGHAVYSISDPRAVILKENAKKFSEGTEFEKEFRLLEIIEDMTPQVFAKAKNEKKRMCANVDLYSGLIYKMLNIPEDLFTPMFAIARVPGWCAHRLEELMTGGRIIRPAYKSVALPQKYIPLEKRTAAEEQNLDYIPMEERV